MTYQKAGALSFVVPQDFTIADIVHFGWLWRREFAGSNHSPMIRARRSRSFGSGSAIIVGPASAKPMPPPR